MGHTNCHHCHPHQDDHQDAHQDDQQDAHQDDQPGVDMRGGKPLRALGRSLGGRWCWLRLCRSSLSYDQVLMISW